MNKLIDTGAVAAVYCVADEAIDAFRRFHAALYAQQPEETRRLDIAIAIRGLP